MLTDRALSRITVSPSKNFTFRSFRKFYSPPFPREIRLEPLALKETLAGQRSSQREGNLVLVFAGGDGDGGNADGFLVIRSIAADVFDGSQDGGWDWRRSGQPGAVWLVSVLIGDVGQVDMFAFWGDPAEGALVVAMYISLSSGGDVISEFYGIVETISTDVALQVQDIGVINGVTGSTTGWAGVGLALAAEGIGSQGSGEAD